VRLREHTHGVAIVRLHEHTRLRLRLRLEPRGKSDGEIVLARSTCPVAEDVRRVINEQRPRPRLVDVPVPA